MGNKNVPEVRFPWFSEAWEQRKVIDIAPLQRGFDLPVSEIEEGPFPVIMSNGIGAYHSKFKAKAPGVITGRSGTIGNLTFVDADYWPHNTALWVTDFKSNDAKFIYYLYQKLDLKRYGTGSGVPTLNRNDVHDTVTNIPSVLEQKQISWFFDSLDNLITLHQRELNTLKQTKQGFLQKMFPKEGESVPEVRFQGFSGNWEIKKLFEVTEKVVEKNKNKLYAETLTNSAEFGIISQRDFFEKEISNVNNLDGYYIVQPDDFVYNPRISKHAPVGPIKRNNLGRVGVMSPLYYVFRVLKGDKRYIETFFSSSSWHIFMKLNGDSGARSDRFAIKDAVFKEMPIPFPTQSEQMKIGEFFYQLDQTIALQEKELQVLQQTKKAFLQKMFV